MDKYYLKEKSEEIKICIVCRSKIDFEEEYYKGIIGSKVAGRCLCRDCYTSSERIQKEQRLHDNAKLPYSTKRINRGKNIERKRIKEMKYAERKAQRAYLFKRKIYTGISKNSK